MARASQVAQIAELEGDILDLLAYGQVEVLRVIRAAFGIDELHLLLRPAGPDGAELRCQVCFGRKFQSARRQAFAQGERHGRAEIGDAAETQPLLLNHLAVVWAAEEDAVARAHDRAMVVEGPPRQPDARREIVFVPFPQAFAVAVAPRKRDHAFGPRRDQLPVHRLAGERMRDARIEVVHAVAHFDDRRFDLIAQAEVEREPLAELPVVVDVTGEVKAALADAGVHAAIDRINDAQQEAGQRQAGVGDQSALRVAPLRRRGHEGELARGELPVDLVAVEAPELAAEFQVAIPPDPIERAAQLRVGEGRQPVLIARRPEAGHRHAPGVEIETRESVRLDAPQSDFARYVLAGAGALAHDADARA